MIIGRAASKSRDGATSRLLDEEIVTAEDVRAVPPGRRALRVRGRDRDAWAREIAATRGVRIVHGAAAAAPRRAGRHRRRPRRLRAQGGAEGAASRAWAIASATSVPSRPSPSTIPTWRWPSPARCAVRRGAARHPGGRRRHRLRHGRQQGARRAGRAVRDVAAARNAREHNDANVLTLGARFVDAARMREIVEAFLTGPAPRSATRAASRRSRPSRRAIREDDRPAARRSGRARGARPAERRRRRPAPATPPPAAAAPIAWAGCWATAPSASACRPGRPVPAGDRAAHRPHAAQARRDARADRDAVPRRRASTAFATVCVNPVWVPLCADLLRGIRDAGLHRRRLPAGRHAGRGQGGTRPNARGRGGRLRGRHGDERRRA